MGQVCRSAAGKPCDCADRRPGRPKQETDQASKRCPDEGTDRSGVVALASLLRYHLHSWQLLRRPTTRCCRRNQAAIGPSFLLMPGFHCQIPLLTFCPWRDHSFSFLFCSFINAMRAPIAKPFKTQTVPEESHRAGLYKGSPISEISPFLRVGKRLSSATYDWS
jgi:hypothetical protein